MNRPNLEVGGFMFDEPKGKLEVSIDGGLNVEIRRTIGNLTDVVANFTLDDIVHGNVVLCAPNLEVADGKLTLTILRN